MGRRGTGCCEVCNSADKKIIRLMVEGLTEQGMKLRPDQQRALLAGNGTVDVCWPSREDMQCIMTLKNNNPLIHFEPQDDDLADFWTY